MIPPLFGTGEENSEEIEHTFSSWIKNNTIQGKLRYYRGYSFKPAIRQGSTTCWVEVQKGVARSVAGFATSADCRTGERKDGQLRPQAAGSRLGNWVRGQRASMVLVYGDEQ